MKIGYFASFLPCRESFPNPGFSHRHLVGGVEVCAYHLARKMAKLGHEVFVFTTSFDSKIRVEEKNGIKVYRCGLYDRERVLFSRHVF